jgi:hypothetical protein
VCRHTALLGHNSRCVDIPIHSGTRAVCLHTDCCARVERYVYTRLLCPSKSGTCTHGLLCPSRAVRLHTDCCARKERYVYTRTVVYHSTRAQQSVCRHTALLGYNSPCVDIPLYSGTTVRPRRAGCLHTNCCARVERYVCTRTVVPE